jgi:hypothetical protein
MIFNNMLSEEEIMSKENLEENTRILKKNICNHLADGSGFSLGGEVAGGFGRSV